MQDVKVLEASVARVESTNADLRGDVQVILTNSTKISMDLAAFLAANPTPAAIDLQPFVDRLNAIADGTATVDQAVKDAAVALAAADSTIVVTAPAIVVSPSGASIAAGTTQQFTASVASPSWSSSNEAAATVDQSGLVTAVAEGTAVITASLASATDGTASISVFAA